MQNIIEEEGFNYQFNPEACKKCGGNCCCGESGNIWITEKDIAAISKLLNINNIDFIADYTIRIDNRLSLTEKETENGFECIFFGESVSSS